MEVKLKVLELFAGIGGFSVGLERTGGFETAAFCEIDKHARKVLQKNWPSVPIYEDVREITIERLEADGTIPDVITGGFPCQDISTAGLGAGLAGARSGLWFEFARIIKEVRPRWVIAENVSVLRSRGLDQVLRSLAEIGYDAEWHCIPASAVGAPHQRDRIWIVAYPSSKGLEGTPRSILQGNLNRPSPCGWTVQGCWTTEPNVGRVAYGIPGRTHRLKQLGNAVVPQIPEIIGRAILERMEK